MTLHRSCFRFHIREGPLPSCVAVCACEGRAYEHRRGESAPKWRRWNNMALSVSKMSFLLSTSFQRPTAHNSPFPLQMHCVQVSSRSVVCRGSVCSARSNSSPNVTESDGTEAALDGAGTVPSFCRCRPRSGTFLLLTPEPKFSSPRSDKFFRAPARDRKCNFIASAVAFPRLTRH